MIKLWFGHGLHIGMYRKDHPRRMCIFFMVHLKRL